MVALLRAFAGSGLLIATTVLAQAADPVKLRVADSFPKGHYLVKLILEPWMEEVTKRTNGAVTFEHYPAQQLGKATDMLKFLLPHYIAEGKSYLTVAFGCTGGQHRSVFIAEEIKKRLEADGHRVKTAHRDMPR